MQLFTRLSDAPGKTSLSEVLVDRAFAAASDSTRQRARALVAANRPDAREETARLEPFRLAMEGGDAKRGRLLFFAAKSACSACHRIAGKGESIGPDLSTIGNSRTRRDLWEAVLKPSASLARGYESFSIRDDAGTMTTGIIAAETVDEIVVRTTRRDELRIRRDQIDQIAPSTTSIMPQGLEQTMTPAELADLLAFLESLK
jgi:putative heme-binding domain-containing protein